MSEFRLFEEIEKARHWEGRAYDTETGELLDEEAEAYYEQTRDEIREIALDLCALKTEREAEAKAIGALVAKLQKRKAACVARVERIKGALAYSFDVGAKDRDERGGFSISAPERLELDPLAESKPLDLLPREYLRHRPEEWAPAKDDILRALKSGADIPGAKIVRRKQVRFK